MPRPSMDAGSAAFTPTPPPDPPPEVTGRAVDAVCRSETPGLSEAASEQSAKDTARSFTPVPPTAPPQQSGPRPPPAAAPRPASAPPLAPQPPAARASPTSEDGGEGEVAARRPSCIRSADGQSPTRRVSLFAEPAESPGRFREGKEGEVEAAAAIQSGWRRSSAVLQAQKQKRHSSAARIQKEWKDRKDKQIPDGCRRSRSFAYTAASRPVMVDESSEFGRAYQLARRSSRALEEFLPDARRHLGVTKAADFSVAAHTAIRVRRQSAKLLTITGRASLCGSEELGRRASMRLIERGSDEPWWRARNAKSIHERQQRTLRDAVDESDPLAPVPAAPCPGLPSTRPVSSPNYQTLLLEQSDDMEHLRKNDSKYKQMMTHFGNITKAAHERLERICQVIDAWQPRLETQPGSPTWWESRPPPRPASARPPRREEEEDLEGTRPQTAR